MTRSLLTISGMTAASRLMGMGVATARTMPERDHRPTPAPTILHCKWGNAEDSCYPDYIGKGNWTLRKGEPPAQKLPPFEFIGTVDGHKNCWSLIGPTSILVCPDGFTETS